jgi:hypothetical protein
MPVRCPHRHEWYTVRDNLYEAIMRNSWNANKGFFSQSFEDRVRMVLKPPILLFT